jgi:HPt (histidine-containing phosphotransfer) domain-containing protein
MARSNVGHVRQGDRRSPEAGREGCDVLDAEVLAGLKDLQSVGGDVQELVRVFTTSSTERLECLRTAARAGDAEALGRAAHSLRGSSGSLGGRRVADICAVLEAPGELDSATRSELLDRLSDELGLVHAALSAAFAGDAGPARS